MKSDFGGSMSFAINVSQAFNLVECGTAKACASENKGEKTNIRYRFADDEEALLWKDLLTGPLLLEHLLVQGRTLRE